MVKPPTDPRLSVYDWTFALSHLASVRADIVAAARISAWGSETAIIVDIRPLEHCYEAGERSQALYEAMMKVKFR